MTSVYSLLCCVFFASLTGCDSLAQTRTVTTVTPGDPSTTQVSERYQDTQDDTAPWSLSGWATASLDTGKDADYLSDVERQVILHLNLVRAAPLRYAQDFIEPRLKFFKDKIYLEPGGAANFGGIETEEGTAAVIEAIRALAATAPLPSLSPSPGLSRAAGDHARDQSTTGQIGHVGSDGSLVDTRVTRYGNWIDALGENIVYGTGIGRDIVVELLIDDGVPGRGHRKNILNPEFRRVGVALATHPEYGHICVIDFAAGFVEGR